ncbi:MAG: hypothetical protein ACXWMB_06200 [Candidatus Limnocylindria bacterium]
MIAASLAAAAALALPTTALASTAQIGSTGWSTPICTMLRGPIDSVQATSSGNAYAMPSGGSITSWSVAAGADAGPVGLEVWRETAPQTFALVATSSAEPLEINATNKFDLGPTSVFGPTIPVEAGDLIGLRIEGDFACWRATTDPSDTVWLNFATQSLTTVLSSMQLNVAATVDVTANLPTSADQCKNGGWKTLTDNAGTSFKNQGDCVSFVATGGSNTAAGS